MLLESTNPNSPSLNNNIHIIIINIPQDVVFFCDYFSSSFFPLPPFLFFDSLSFFFPIHFTSIPDPLIIIILIFLFSPAFSSLFVDSSFFCSSQHDFFVHSALHAAITSLSPVCFVIPYIHNHFCFFTIHLPFFRSFKDQSSDDIPFFSDSFKLQTKPTIDLF